MKIFFIVLILGTCSFNTITAQIADTVKTAPVRAIRFRQTSLFVPASLMVAGIGANSNHPEAIKMELREERNEKLSSFKTKIDNYLQFSPLVIAYGLDLAGIRSKNDLANRTAILLKGEMLMLGSVSILKQSTRQLRPDGSAYTSFPSGHTAQAFAAATFLSEEYRDKLPWMPYAAYTLAGSVGALRIANNRHYISDVLFGAGLGYLSMKVSYWSHRYKWNKAKHAAKVFL